MNIDISAAALATIISTLVSTIVAMIINKHNSLKRLDDQLENILKISIEYPYLESEKFTKTWILNKDSDKEEYLRYDCYCTMVFNYLERLCRHYKFDTKKIEYQPLNIRAWVRLHKDYWNHPSDEFENIEGYPKEFKNIIREYLS